MFWLVFGRFAAVLKTVHMILEHLNNFSECVWKLEFILVFDFYCPHHASSEVISTNWSSICFHLKISCYFCLQLKLFYMAACRHKYMDVVDDKHFLDFKSLIIIVMVPKIVQ